MVAVVIVVLDHLTGWPAGGFAGVDVFFVVSGFLITGRLLKMAQDDQVGIASYFGQFYKLRAIRILPAAAVTLITTGVACSLFLSPERASSTWLDIIWAALFLANWHFVANGTDYLHASGPVSPIQHYWSLAVEEQFYIVWPLVLLFAVFIAQIFGGTLRAKRILAFCAAMTVGAVSFGWAISQSEIEPTVSYFSSATRAWELAVGAMIACAAPLIAKAPAVVAPVASWSGLGLILVSIFIITDNTPFPAPGAILPIFGSALIIIGGGIAEPRNSILTNRISVWIGDLSYSIYLVHFPLVIVVTSLLPHNRLLSWAAVLLATLGLSMLSYYFVEEPLRNHFERSRAKERDLSRLAGLGAIVTCCAFITFAFQSPPAFVNADASVAPTADPTASVDSSFALPTDSLARALQEGISGASLQAVENTHEATIAGATVDWRPCASGTEVLESCIFKPPTSDPSKVALVVGDSIAQSYIPAVREALVPHGWTVIGFGMGQCPAALVSVTRPGSNGRYSECDAHHSAYQAVIARYKPALVVMSNISLTIQNMYGNKTQLAYQEGMTRAVDSLTTGGAKAVILTPPPFGKSLAECNVPGATAADCTAKVTNQQRSQWIIDQDVAQANGIGFINVMNLFCYNGYCPAIVDGYAVRYDVSHLTPSFGRLIAPSLYNALETQGLIPGA